MVKFDYTKDDIRRIAKEENVRFLRLMFTDLYGTIKNVEVPISQLDKVLDNKMTQLLSFIGAHTLDVYVLHFFIVRSISMAFLCSYFDNYNYLILELLIISPISILIAVISVYIGRVIRANKRIESFIFFR